VTRAAEQVFTGDGFRYALRRSKRAKNIRITVGDDGVVLTLPERTAERHGHGFIAERSDWIRRTLAKIEAADEIVARRLLADGSAVPYLGDELTLRLLSGPSGRVTYRADRAELAVRVPDPRRETVSAALERWYRRQARELIAERLDAVVLRNGTSYKRIAIRDQRTRWGSCSTSGTLSFNWRLLLAPETVLDYVIEHEAAHIEVRDHSERFWALLESRCEHTRESRLWLRRHGSTLRLI
jgi:predicted metal-dependent hydrolase